MAQKTSQEKNSFVHLQKGYSLTQRVLQVFSLAGFVILSVLFFSQIVSGFTFGKAVGLTLVLFLAILVADFLSGFFHWAADTWGNVNWPIIGKAVIQSFRMHHVDQKGITRHNFLQTNGDVALVVVPLQLFGYLFFHFVYSSYFLMSFFGLFTFVGLFTNQIHKWAHQDQVSSVIAFLQRKRLILSPKHHQLHHTAPYTKHYCITFGWMNSFLLWIGFFPFMESVITILTGAVPRKDGVDETLSKKNIRNKSRVEVV